MRRYALSLSDRRTDYSDLLIVRADLWKLSQQAIDCRKHLAHADFGNRAFDDNDELGFV